MCLDLIGRGVTSGVEVSDEALSNEFETLNAFPALGR